MTYYYFGEFGYFINIILGELEQFVTKNPAVRGYITIYSYTNYCTVIDNLFPGFFCFQYQEYLFPFRHGHNFKDSFSDNEKYKGMKRLEDLFENIPKDILCTFEEATKNNGNWMYLGKSVTKKVQVTNTKVEEMMKGFKKTHVYFFRQRNRYDSHRNFWHTPEIEGYLNQSIENLEILNVVYMCSDECYYPPFISTRILCPNPPKNIYVCEEFKEAITFFNNCDTFFSNDSGLIELAKICGVKEIVIMPNWNWLPTWPGFTIINPFGANILSVVKK
jgi:hypothetical protein